MLAYYGDDEAAINQNLRNLYDMYQHIVTDRAKKIIVDNQLMQAVDAYYDKFLRDKVEPITLN